MSFNIGVNLDKYKEIKISTVNSLRDSKLLTFTYNDVEFQTRPEDRENILGQALEISLGSDEDVSWIAADNSVITFAPEEFVTFAKEVAEHKRECIFKGRMMKDAILAAISKEEVDNISWPE
ncbi:hypothetical protein M316_0111 [Nitrincola phage 1M3-16]|uniref:hypothetical protein n=1 Tax=Nitrincola phage 1M3-16 TaxID=1472912 RepID=UPI000444DDC1|nr:hypothetical protein GJ22_gp041 [Nitrincola phage 1M3-16]AHX01176.1 hypothetical protein M316_0111 [Nitrincola phage 1M3-16]